MCQLCLVKTKQPRVTAEIMFSAMMFDSIINNDGFGIWNKSLFLKTINSLKTDDKLYERLNDFKNSSVLCAHFRRASKGISITKENAHPFNLKYILGAHNGTLFWKDEKVDYTWNQVQSLDSRESDSLRYLTDVDTKLGEGFSMVEALQASMKDVRGKFAFLITDKRDGKYYVVKGRTADLYFANLLGDNKDTLGLVINTDEDSLKTILQFSKRRLRFSGLIETDFEFSIPSEVEDESIFLVDGYNLKKIGELKENSFYVYQAPVVITTKPATTEYSHNAAQQPVLPITPRNQQKFGGDESLPLFRRAANFAFENKYSLLDMDILFRIIFSKSIFECGYKEFTLFMDAATKYFVLSGSKEKTHSSNWFNTNLFINLENLEKAGFVFPLCLNNKPQIIDVGKSMSRSK